MTIWLELSLLFCANIQGESDRARPSFVFSDSILFCWRFHLHHWLSRANTNSNSYLVFFFWVNIDSWVYDARRTGSTPHWVHEYFVVITEWVLIYLFVEDSNYHLDSLDSITRKYSILRKWWATHLLKREPITGLYPPPVRIKYLYPGSSNALLVAQW